MTADCRDQPVPVSAEGQTQGAASRPPRTAVQQLAASASIYERQRALDCADAMDFCEGSLSALFIVVSSECVSESARSALLAAADRGGFASQDVLWLTTNLADTTRSEDPPPAPQAPDLLQVIESVDPFCLVALDQKAGTLLSRAYNQPIKLDAPDEILGRPCCCFVHFDRMLQTDDRKQRAWALLKEMFARLSYR